MVPYCRARVCAPDTEAAEGGAAAAVSDLHIGQDCSV